MMQEQEYEDEEQQKGFYEAKGLIRRTLIIEPTTKDAIKALAKRFKLTQGEIIDVLVAHADIDAIERAGHFRAKRESRSDGRSSPQRLVNQLKNLPPEQLDEIKKLLQLS